VARDVKRIGYVAFAAYIGTIFAANYFITHVGTQPFPGGPHTIPVGFGYRAPSGVLWIGLAFTLRDVVQRALGRVAVVSAIALGAVLSYFVAPSLAWASACAFGVSEVLDFAVYTPLAERRPLTAVVTSNVVGTLVDTFLFLWLAFESIEFWQGQVIGKLWMTALAVAVIVPVRRRALSRQSLYAAGA
jgi:uncharacterized PurR-regulated membrane protein YhhQ (DUF165 family)